MYCIKKNNVISPRFRNYLEKNNYTKNKFLRIVSKRIESLYNSVFEDVKYNIYQKKLNKAYVMILSQESAKHLVELNNLHVILYKEGYRSAVSPSISSLTTITTTTTRKKTVETKTTTNTIVSTFPGITGDVYCTTISTKSKITPTSRESKVKGIRSTTTTSSWSAPPFQPKRNSSKNQK
ncbi:hypothetical protein RB653_005722 [Dictyostelium firmibasis]|uniref:Uncharacterized protein n=1 Tax=Dictyostelium firmibasis TaxID=79012 RepID=A0AAN7UD60_9MYCE